jgi:hypothetical protein
MKMFLSIFGKYLDDVLLVLGCACMLIGVSKISIVATWIIGGVMLIVFGVLIGKVKAKHVNS